LLDNNGIEYKVQGLRLEKEDRGQKTEDRGQKRLIAIHNRFWDYSLPPFALIL